MHYSCILGSVGLGDWLTIIEDTNACSTMKAAGLKRSSCRTLFLYLFCNICYFIDPNGRFVNMLVTGGFKDNNFQLIVPHNYDNLFQTAHCQYFSCLICRDNVY